MAAPAKRVRLGRVSKTRARRFGPLLVRTLTAAARPGPHSAHHIALGPHETHPALVHRRTWEFLLVLDGLLLARINGRRRRMRAGGFAVLPPGTAHAFSAGPRGVAVLSVFAPPLDLEKPDVVLV